MTAPSQNELDKAIEHHVDERHEWIRALVYCLIETSDGKPSFEDDVMTIDAHFEDHVLLKTEVFNQLLLTAKRSKEMEKERDTYFNRLGEHATAILSLEQELSTIRTDYKQAQHDKERLLNVLEHSALDPDKQPPEQHLVARMVVKELRPLAIETMKGEV